MATNLSKEQKNAIDNYGSEIETLKDFVTAVRKRPGMMLGPIGSSGFLNMQREIFQNSIDQIMDPNSPADSFIFFYDERTKEVIVEDSGRGFPFEDIIRILTQQYTSKNYEKKLGQYSSGLNGVGAKVVNALSDTFVVESYRYDGKAVRMEFEKGYPKTKQPVPIPNPNNNQGAKIIFVPDETILGNINLEWKRTYRLIKDVLSMTPIGSKCIFQAIDINGKKFIEEIINKDGIISNLITNVNRPLNKPIRVFDDDGIHKLELVFCYDTGDDTTGISDTPSITSYSNLCPTLAGTHVDGCLEGICRWFSMYMNNIYLANQKNTKVKITAVDVKSGLNMMINAAHLEPQFDSQSKDILSNEDMIGFCKDVVMKGLDDWSKANPQDLSKICKFLKEMAELRLKQEEGKAKIVTKYAKNPITNLPRKYVKPTGKTGIELFIVEGDSALGKAKEDRDPTYQGKFMPHIIAI